MNIEVQLKLQAYLDGELSEREAREVAAALEQHSEGRQLLAELRNTKTALVGNEPTLKLTEGRDFYWSKIEREIERLDASPAIASARPGWLDWRKFMVPFGALAGVVALCVSLWPNRPALTEAKHREEVVSTPLPEVTAVTFRNESEGTTVIWLTERTNEKMPVPPETDRASATRPEVDNN